MFEHDYDIYKIHYTVQGTAAGAWHTVFPHGKLVTVLLSNKKMGFIISGANIHGGRFFTMRILGLFSSPYRGVNASPGKNLATLTAIGGVDAQKRPPVCKI